MPRNLPVARISELSPGQRKLVFIDGRSVALFNIEGALHAIDNSCPHNGASLAGGQLNGTVLQCPAHGLRFDLATGCMPAGAGLCLKTFPVHVIEEDIVLELPDMA
ncbi:Rieske (2Fe-2S) protein [Ralstonia soli]|uniref:Rieske 2Fe-2S domain-containing protein n=1 Tax=Ralstonia soli TaxID=2953896 RepID=A0ABT1AM82_9RALS|nr:Rieske 2Fe-2S domain-containing protein [Ralstonia soli]MCO5399545.1 Rieske 2Fe-2S domain-containing protein [Ralstonia soli]